MPVRNSAYVRSLPRVQWAPRAEGASSWEKGEIRNRGQGGKQLCSHTKARRQGRSVSHSQRQTSKQIGGEKKHRQTENITDRWTDESTDRETERDSQTEPQTDKPTDSQIDRLTDRQEGKKRANSRHTQTNRKIASTILNINTLLHMQEGEGQLTDRQEDPCRYPRPAREGRREGERRGWRGVWWTSLTTLAYTRPRRVSS